MRTTIDKLAGPLLAVVTVVATYGFFASFGTFSWKAEEVEVHKYAALAEAFRLGRIDLPVGADPGFHALENPYDPAQRRGLAFPWDTAYFEGKFYLYFTPLPALLVDLPWRLAFGHYPPRWFSGWCLAVAAFGSILLLWRLLWARGWPDLSPSARTAWILVLGLGSPIPFALSPAWVYQSAILSGVVFSFATLLFALLAQRRADRDPRLLAAAGGSAALAVCARPDLVIALGLVCLWLLLRRPPNRDLPPGSRLLPLCAGAAPVLLAQAAYNRARFGRFTDFGQNYNLSVADYVSEPLCRIPTTPLDVSRLLELVEVYLAQAPSFSASFPYVLLAAPSSELVQGFIGEPVLGLFFSLPLLTGSALLLAGRRARPSVTASPTSADASLELAGLGTLGALSTLLLLGTCSYAAQRYTLDPMPFLMLGAIAIAGRAEPERSTVWGRCILAAMLVQTVLFCVLPAFSGNFGSFERARPELIGALRSLLF